MAGRVTEEKITLGMGVLEIGEYDANGSFTVYRDLGAIKGEVEIGWTRNINVFKTGRPLVAIKEECTEEAVMLRCQLAEISLGNLKDALGAGTITSSVTPVFVDGTSIAPAGDMSSSVRAVGLSNVLKMGGDTTVLKVALRFTHQKSGSTKRQIFELFIAQPKGQLALPYKETDWNTYTAEWEGLADLTKTAGNQFFQFIDEI